MRMVDATVNVAVHSADALWVLNRAVAMAEEERRVQLDVARTQEKMEREAAKVKAKAEAEAVKAAARAEAEAAKAMEEAAKALAKARAKEEASRQKEEAAKRRAQTEGERELAEAQARAEAEARAAEATAAKEAERLAKAEALAQKLAAKETAAKEAAERKEIAAKEAAAVKEAAAAEAAERKAAAQRAKLEAERVRVQAVEIARQERQEHEEEAARRTALFVAERDQAEARARSEAEARAAAKQDAQQRQAAEATAAKEAERQAKQEARTTKLAAKEAAAKDAAERKEAAAAEAAERKAAASSPASAITQQRLERAQGRLSQNLRRRSVDSDGVSDASGKVQGMFGLGRRHSAAARVHEKEIETPDSAPVAPRSEFATQWALAWRSGGARNAEFDVATDCVASEGNEVVCSGADGDRVSVCVYSATTKTVSLSLKGHTDRITSVAVMAMSEPDGYLIASGSRDRTIRLWSRRSGACLRVLEGSNDSVFSLAMRRGMLISGEGSSYQGAIAKARLWSLVNEGDEDSITACSSAKLKTVFAEHGGSIWSVALGDDVAVSASDDGTVRVWPIRSASSRSIASMKHPAWVCSVSLLPESMLCATGCGDSKVRLWSLDAASLSTPGGICMQVIEHCAGASGTYPMRVRWVCETALISSGMDHTIRLWSRDRTSADQGDSLWTCITSFSHRDNVRGLAVSLGGRLVASSGGSKTKSVALWTPMK